jgi:hypothetical protein
LFGAGLLYLAVAGLTLAATFLPGLNPSTNITYQPPRIVAPIDSRYQITDRAGQTVGELTCRVTPLGTKVSLDCSSSIQGYEVKLPSSYFKDVDHTDAWRVVWDGTTFAPLEYSFERKTPDGSVYSAEVKDGKLVTTSPAGTDQADLPENFLVEYEWAWRVNDLNADIGSVYRVPFGYLLRWDQAQKKALPTFKDEILHVYPVETLDLPAGRFEAWKVTVAGQAAWYARDDTGYPRPVQFDDGMVIYSLVK